MRQVLLRLSSEIGKVNLVPGHEQRSPGRSTCLGIHSLRVLDAYSGREAMIMGKADDTVIIVGIYTCQMLKF